MVVLMLEMLTFEPTVPQIIDYPSPMSGGMQLKF